MTRHLHPPHVTHRFGILLSCAVLVAALAACGGDDSAPAAAPSAARRAPASAGQPTEPAFDAVKRQLDELSKGQYGREWDELHPAQQALVPRDSYVKCATADGPIGVDNVKELEHYADSVSIPGTALKVDSTAVTVSLTQHRGTQSADQKHTFHEVPLDGQWKWLLADTDPYKSGKCP